VELALTLFVTKQPNTQLIGDLIEDKKKKPRGVGEYASEKGRVSALTLMSIA
jgi:hypothetical protein